MIYNNEINANKNRNNEMNMSYEIQDNFMTKSINTLSDINSILEDDDYFHDEELDDFFFFFYEYTDDINYDNVYNEDNVYDEDYYTSTLLHYYENYNMKLLCHIANYYDIPKRKMKKEDLITLIVDYENDPNNSVIVYNRKRYWHYIQELQKDKYFGKYITFH